MLLQLGVLVEMVRWNRNIVKKSGKKLRETRADSESSIMKMMRSAVTPPVIIVASCHGILDTHRCLSTMLSNLYEGTSIRRDTTVVLEANNDGGIQFILAHLA